MVSIPSQRLPVNIPSRAHTSHRVVVNIASHRLVVNITGHRLVVNIPSHRLVVNIPSHRLVVNIASQQLVVNILSHRLVVNIPSHRLVVNIPSHRLVSSSRWLDRWFLGSRSDLSVVRFSQKPTLIRPKPHFLGDSSACVTSPLTREVSVQWGCHQCYPKSCV